MMVKKKLCHQTSIDHLQKGKVRWHFYLSRMKSCMITVKLIHLLLGLGLINIDCVLTCFLKSG